jgi:putative transposase
MERFSNLYNSYTKSYNKVFNGKGALFIDYLKRSEISNDIYFCNLVNYIRFNAVHHGFCKNPLDWKWTSLHAFLADKRTRIKKDDVLKMFEGTDKFKLAHARMARPLYEYEFI